MGQEGQHGGDRHHRVHVRLRAGLCDRDGEEFIYYMGHFPAPWGNEIRVGELEAFMALFFCAIMLLSMLGAQKKG